MTTLQFIIFGLATFRLASFIIEEDGPFEIMFKIRDKLGVDYEPETLIPFGKNGLARQLVCIWCLTPWIGLFWLFFWLLSQRVAFYAAIPLALSTVALYLHGRGIRFRKNQW